MQFVEVRNIADYLEKKLDIKPGQTTPEGLFTLREWNVSAPADMLPAMQINTEFYELSYFR